MIFRIEHIDGNSRQRGYQYVGDLIEAETLKDKYLEDNSDFNKDESLAVNIVHADTPKTKEEIIDLLNSWAYHPNLDLTIKLRDKQAKSEPVDLKKFDTFISVMQNFFGFGETLKEAKDNMRRESGLGKRDIKQFVVYKVHPDTSISHIDGSLKYPDGYNPIEVEKIGFDDDNK
jgi:hypothetical protein